MSFAETVLLGALAGSTIFLGLPFGRLQVLSDRMRVALCMFAVGVLAFLFVDVFEHGFEIVEHAVEGFKEGDTGFGKPLGLIVLLGVGFAGGTAGLAMFQRMRPRGSTRPPIAGGSTEVLDIDAATRVAAERDA